VNLTLRRTGVEAQATRVVSPAQPRGFSVLQLNGEPISARRLIDVWVGAARGAVEQKLGARHGTTRRHW